MRNTFATVPVFIALFVVIHGIIPFVAVAGDLAVAL